jgi:hypothetical protein
MPAHRLRINATESASEHAKETRLDSECLLLEISGQTWYVPFDTLEWIPRVGETIQVAAAIEAQYQRLNTNLRRNRLLFVLASRWQATAYTPDPHESWSKYPDRGNYPRRVA